MLSSTISAAQKRRALRELLTPGAAQQIGRAHV